MKSVTAQPTLAPIKLQITGMTCASYVMRVEKALKAVPGVQAASVNLAIEEATVSADAGLSAGVLADAVRDAGYDVATNEVALQVEGMTCARLLRRPRGEGLAGGAGRRFGVGEPGDREGHRPGAVHRTGGGARGGRCEGRLCDSQSR